MPRLVTSRSAKSVQGWVFKSDQLAQVFAPFVTDAVDHVALGKSSRVASAALARGDADKSTRIAVPANLHDVVGLQAFTQLPQATTGLELDDALLMPFI